MEVAKKNKEDEDEQVALPGFRFHPTDEELVGFYLKRKVEKRPISIELIKQIDIYKYDPWDLPKVSTVGEKEWYFFCIRGRKYRNSIRPNRVTGSGFWKATGIDKPIYSVKEPHDCIGLKKSLVYYRGSAGKGTKTDWMMHEFRLPPNSNATKDIALQAEVWTLCRILKRIPSYKKYMASDQPTKATKLSSPPILTTTEDSTTTSKTCSFETDQYSDQTTQSWSLLNYQPPMFPVSYNNQSFMNPNNGEDFFTNGNWDELRPVVQLAVDHPLSQEFMTLN
ncbi:hypothetical protein UlMin_020934 [Ulmus minor]